MARIKMVLSVLFVVEQRVAYHPDLPVGARAMGKITEKTTSNQF